MGVRKGWPSTISRILLLLCVASTCQATASESPSRLDCREAEASAAVVSAFDEHLIGRPQGAPSDAFDNMSMDAPISLHVIQDKREDSSTSTKASATTTSTPNASTAPIATFAVPEPFDAGLGSNFTESSCPKFIQQFLADPALIACHPVSLLLQSSTGFFDDTKSFNTTTLVLEASCSASLANCSTIMSSYASQLVTSSNCGSDYSDGNPVVLEALDGLLAYEPVYRATCLKDGTPADKYCFADTITNTSSPTGSYVYYLPVGVELPADSIPTCNGCLKTTMSEFAKYASSSTQPLSNTYNTAARQINRYCGADFVNSNVTVTSGGTAALASGTSWLAALLLLVLLLV